MLALLAILRLATKNLPIAPASWPVEQTKNLRIKKSRMKKEKNENEKKKKQFNVHFQSLVAFIIPFGRLEVPGKLHRQTVVPVVDDGCHFNTWIYTTRRVDERREFLSHILYFLVDSHDPLISLIPSVSFESRLCWLVAVVDVVWPELPDPPTSLFPLLVWCWIVVALLSLQLSPSYQQSQCRVLLFLFFFLCDIFRLFCVFIPPPPPPSMIISFWVSLSLSCCLSRYRIEAHSISVETPPT